ncbi:uncharacterized protein [Triticum aestivum]|uniref:uncharacterized protein n=1 Tax=Triticum aestivum TaxID=4565 RepID=UPI001D004452|nr:uncharacterized protein LOC123065504 [Triticum aestivum]
MSRTSPSLQHLPSHPDQSRIRPPRHRRSVTMSTAAAMQAGEAATCRTRCCGTFWSRRVFIGGKTTSSSFNSILVAAVHLFLLCPLIPPVPHPRQGLQPQCPWYAVLLSDLWLVDGTCIFQSFGIEILLLLSNMVDFILYLKDNFFYIFSFGRKFRAYIAGYFYRRVEFYGWDCKKVFKL